MGVYWKKLDVNNYIKRCKGNSNNSTDFDPALHASDWVFLTQQILKK